MRITQTDLARLVGCSQNSVSGYERGAHRPDLKPEVGDRLVRLFGAPLVDLLGPPQNDESAVGTATHDAS